MAVIINEFEVSVVTPLAKSSPKAEERPMPDKAPPTLKPMDVTDIVRRFAERRDRLRAY
jgi:hypothetical protein